ncbi:MAG TPA: transcription elongation factor GreA [Candidatus Peregrinibacteria bacterium]|nr:transcription elongation factor GreA [Candidatus Peregrinibacteria bacterium]
MANTTANERTFITREGLKKLEGELEHLKTVRRKEIAKRLEEAISYGDLSENSEYEEAKNEQAFAEGRIIELESKIKSAEIIAKRRKESKTVQVGTKVVLRNVTKKGDSQEYIIVGSTEADPFNNKISNESPIGSALIDKVVGDKIKVTVPAGEFSYEVVKLK